MFNIVKLIIFISIVVLAFSSIVLSKDKSFYEKIEIPLQANTTDSINFNTLIKPAHAAVQQTGKINASFNNQGQFGNGFGSGSITNPNASFETPAFSHIEYLFGGGIWVGAIVGDDTLVSCGVDGWHLGEEFGVENALNPNVEKAWFQSDYSFRTEYADTMTVGIPPEWQFKKRNPLHINIVNRSHIWRDDPFDNAIFYDILIDYIGDADKLDSVYVGFYFDGDVNHPATSLGYTDDFTGSMRDKGIAYIIDNDGDPSGNSFNYASPRKALAFELLATSFTALDTNFNWWLSGTLLKDFGPRLRGTPEDPFRDYRTGGIGTPMGDANKYYIMSHKEWDYDQVYTGSIGPNHPLWYEPRSDVSNFWPLGLDTRFLFSFGPFTIEKGKPERIIFSTFTADSVHTDPNNLDNTPIDPDLYKSSLNLHNIVSVGAEIRQALDLILDPLAPPTGLSVYSEANNYRIKFDPYVFDEVTGHEVYATPVDASAFPFPGAIPPWYKPTVPTHFGSSVELIPQNHIDGLTVINVAYNSEFGVSQTSNSSFLNIPTIEKVKTKPLSTTTTLDSILIEWIFPENSTQPDHYKIYKYLDPQNFHNDYTKPYYSEGTLSSKTVDSIKVDETMWYFQATISPPYVVVDGSKTKFIDHNIDDGATYYIVSVDEYGFESDYSFTTSNLVHEQSKDLLIITNTSNFLYTTSPDSIINYYNTLLNETEISYDIYSVMDSLNVAECSTKFYCPSWMTMSNYKCVVIDESEYTKGSVINELEKYLQTGGKFVNFSTISEYQNVGHFAVPTWYPVTSSSNFGDNYSLLGIDSIFQVGHLYNFPNQIENEKFGFNIARSLEHRFPSLHCDTSRYPLDSNWLKMLDRPTNEPLSVSGFVPSEGATITHMYKSLYPETSYAENIAVGVKNLWSDGLYAHEVYSFGFHLYYMDYNESRNLLRSILDDSSIYPSFYSFTTETGNYFSVDIDSVTLYQNMMDVNDEVGIFDGDLCVGASIIRSEWPLTLIAWEDDPLTPEKDGYTHGNEMTFFCTDVSSGISYSVCPDSLGFIFGDGTFGGSDSAQVGLTNEPCSCCINFRGNVDNDALDQIDIQDLVFLVAYMFMEGAEPICIDEANIDGSTGLPLIDIEDIVVLIAYMFSNSDKPALCP